jgi:hypothetical protein
MESQIGTIYNLPCAVATLPAAQDEDGNFYETPGWSETAPIAEARLTVDGNATTVDADFDTIDED